MKATHITAKTANASPPPRSSIPIRMATPLSTWKTPMATEPATPMAMATMADRSLNQPTARVSMLSPKTHLIGALIRFGQPLRNPKYAITRAVMP